MFAPSPRLLVVMKDLIQMLVGMVLLLTRRAVGFVGLMMVLVLMVLLLMRKAQV